MDKNSPDLVDWLASEIITHDVKPEIKAVEHLFGAAGVGPNQIVLNEWAISTGSHARKGLEDNIREAINLMLTNNFL